MSTNPQTAQAPAPQAPSTDQLRAKMAREVYLPVFLHTLAGYGIEPKTPERIDSLLKQAAVLRRVHEENQQQFDPIALGERKLAYLMQTANPVHQQADPDVTAFLQRVASDEGYIKAAAALATAS